jgi:hypothetical protein
MTLESTDPQVLAPAECFRLLAREPIGRVAISVNALPVILPVRFALDRDEILFRAAPGGVLAEATRDAVIAFEADGSEPGAGSWSVLATGVARHLGEHDARALTSPPPWSSEADVFVALAPQLLSGRRLRECYSTQVSSPLCTWDVGPYRDAAGRQTIATERELR